MLLRLFRGLLTKSCSYVYIDDMLIASTDAEEHQQHLQLEFKCFQEYEVIINLSKCQIGITQLNFLDHSVNSQGIWPLPEKVQAISVVLVPQNHLFSLVPV